MLPSLRRTLALLVLPTAVVLAAPAAAAPVLTQPAAAPQGIIMRDGGICDPIRHMGC